MLVGVESSTKINTGFSVGRRFHSGNRSGEREGIATELPHPARIFRGFKHSRPP